MINNFVNGNQCQLPPAVVKVANAKGQPTSYNLRIPKDVTALKTRITKLGNDDKGAVLSDIKQQLEGLFNSTAPDYGLYESIKVFYDQVRNALVKVNQKSIVAVTIDGCPYRINSKSDKTKAIKKVKTLLLDEKNDYVIKGLDEQLKGLSIANPYEPSVTDLRQIMYKGYIERSVKKQALEGYKIYPELLKTEFLYSNNGSITPKLNLNIPIFRRENDLLGYYKSKYSSSKLDSYLKKPVSERKKTGQDSFEQLSASFYFDVGQILQTQSHTGVFKQVLCVVTTLNLFSHNSSYYSAQGYGRSQKKENSAQLYYFRSQMKHPYISQLGIKSYGNQNIKFVEMLRGFLGEEHPRSKQLLSLSANGNTISKDANYFGLFSAYAGTRANNIEQLSQFIIQKNWNSAQNFLLNFSGIRDDRRFELSRQAMVLFPHQKEVRESITTIIDEFKKISDATTKSWQLSKNLHSQMCKNYSLRAQNITEACKATSFLKVTYPALAPFIFIDLYPNCPSEKKNSANFKEGVTNVIIGFLGGLINYNAKLHGTHIFIQRRQSFGFLRSFITDAGSLRIRLSLGLEPLEFEPIIVKSIKQLDAILAVYDFTAPEKQGAPEIVKEVSSPCELGRTSKTTDKTGNYLLYAMRILDDQWAALLVSQKYIAEEFEIDSKAITQSNENSIVAKSFERYLKDFIHRRAIYKQSHSQGEKDKAKWWDNRQINRDGYTFKNSSPTIDTAKIDKLDEKEGRSEQQKIIQEHVIFQLLQNVIKYIVDLILQDFPLQTEYYHSLCHLLSVVFDNCQRGVYLLSHLQNYKITHTYAVANLIIENILEYVIPLQHLVLWKDDSVKKLYNLEKEYVKNTLNLKSEDIHLFYNDSGEQAIIAGIIAMYNQQQNIDKIISPQIYLFPGSYYEVKEFCDSKNKSNFTNIYSNATICFCDITKIDEIVRYEPFLTKNNKLKAIIIDTTNNNNAESLSKLRDLIAKLHQKDIWVLLANSSLKLEELGLDKYQTGKNIVISPSGAKFDEQTLSRLQDISDAAMNSLIASFRLIVEGICGEISSLQDTKNLKEEQLTQPSNDSTTSGNSSNLQPLNSQIITNNLVLSNKPDNANPNTLSKDSSQLTLSKEPKECVNQSKDGKFYSTNNAVNLLFTKTETEKYLEEKKEEIKKVQVPNVS
jgi:hypothetical protein